MLCITLTVAKHVPDDEARQTIDQLAETLNSHPDVASGSVTAFQAMGLSQLQGCLSSSHETVGFVLSLARARIWGVHLTLLSQQQGALYGKSQSLSEAFSGQAAEMAEQALRVPGGVKVSQFHDDRLVDGEYAPELGTVEAGLQLLCAIERRRSEEAQQAGLIINAGTSQASAAAELGVSQQAVSGRLQAGYWYESRRMAYWLARQMQQLQQIVEY